ncbi:MAG: cupin domain-containing protein [Candidatus Omnitrophica bacterium]|nr:cupin domain-containing protein [Candidatus Omnitrophota bacterium]
MAVKVQKLPEWQLREMGVFSWPIWEKEVSRFPWSYDSVEECYFLEGEVTVEIKDGKSVSFGKGDFVHFPKGLSCTWNIKKPVRKHFNFK